MSEQKTKSYELAPDWHPLSHIDQWLLACGWELDKIHGWYPRHWEDGLEPGHYRLAHYSRETATRFEVSRQEHHLRQYKKKAL